MEAIIGIVALSIMSIGLISVVVGVKEIVGMLAPPETDCSVKPDRSELTGCD